MKLNNKKKYITGVIAAAAAVAVIAECVALIKKDEPNPADSTANVTEKDPAETIKPEGTKETPDTTATPETEKEEEKKQEEKESSGTKPTPVPTPTPVPEVIELPYTLSESGLTIEMLTTFDGAYVENGMDSNVDGVAAILVTNSGKQAIELSEVKINVGGEDLQFSVTSLPAGAAAVVMEKNQKSYEDGELDSLSSTTAHLDTLNMSEDMVTIEDNSAGGFDITNISGSDIPCVRVFYKFYMSEDDVYVGGITYTAKIDGLSAGETRSIAPSHYSAGYSKVVQVRTYDTAE